MVVRVHQGRLGDYSLNKLMKAAATTTRAVDWSMVQASETNSLSCFNAVKYIYI